MIPGPAPSPAREGSGRGQASVRAGASGDEPQLVAMLARAYRDDPLYRWCYPEDALRLEQLEQVFGLFGNQIFGYDETYTTDGILGAAVWIPPDKWRMCAVTKAGVIHGLTTKIGTRHVARALRTLYLMQSRHPPEPSHYHLAFIGVEPQEQRKGLGTALLQPMLEHCDREGLPAYLEATTPDNIAFFERNGFEITQPIALRDGPPLWPMWRDPR